MKFELRKANINKKESGAGEAFEGFDLTGGGNAEDWRPDFSDVTIRHDGRTADQADFMAFMMDDGGRSKGGSHAGRAAGVNANAGGGNFVAGSGFDPESLQADITGRSSRNSGVSESRAEPGAYTGRPGGRAARNNDAADINMVTDTRSGRRAGRRARQEDGLTERSSGGAGRRARQEDGLTERSSGRAGRRARQTDGRNARAAGVAGDSIDIRDSQKQGVWNGGKISLRRKGGSYYVSNEDALSSNIAEGKTSGFFRGRKARRLGRRSASAPGSLADRAAAERYAGRSARITPSIATGMSLGAGGFALGDDGDGFAVNVRNSEPIIKRLDAPVTDKPLIRDLKINLPAAGLVVILMSLFLSAAYLPEQIPFVLPGAAAFLLVTTLESLEKERIRIYAAAVLGVALIAALIILRKYIGGGWALIMDQFYDAAEEAQAYIYDRFNAGSLAEEQPDRCMHLALMWGSALIGVIAALPPVWCRRKVAMIIGAVAMIAFAYYGIVPSWVCLLLLAAALVFAMAGGHVLASLPVLMAALLIFGAVMLVDPGESYGISRADENFRDRFALRSSYLEVNDSGLDGLDGLDQMTGDQDTPEKDDNGGILDEHGWIAGVIAAVAVAAALGVAAWIFWSRYRKRIQANRAGLDSADPREAIVAMFPYTVKWLQPAGIDPRGRNFASLIPVVGADVSEEYAGRYADMYELWKEAAYSDHEIGEDSRQAMGSFLEDTRSMVREKSGFGTRLVNAVKYAL